MTTATMDAAGILKYQSDLIRTGQYMPLGKMQKIAIGPNAAYTPPANDPIIAKVGRFIELRDRPLPLAQTQDRSMLIVPGLLLAKDNRVALPDLPDPNWTAPPPSKEEIEGIEVTDPVTGKKHTEFPKGNSPRMNVPMLPQRLEDRAEGRLEKTNFLVFSPVVGITFQPEIANRMVGDAWLINCSYNPADRTYMALLVDVKTGEVHFFGGLFEILDSSPNSARSPRG
jgi:hypothetical protein